MSFLIDDVHVNEFFIYHLEEKIQTQACAANNIIAATSPYLQMLSKNKLLIINLFIIHAHTDTTKHDMDNFKRKFIFPKLTLWLENNFDIP